MNLITFLKTFFNRLVSRKDEEPHGEEIQQTIPPIKKGSLQDILSFCDEIRKDLWIKKKTDDRLYVEMGNLKDKIERFLEKRERK